MPPKDIFKKHRIVLRFFGILLPGDLKNHWILRVLIQTWFYYMVLLFPLLTLGFLLGVVKYHKVYRIVASLYSIGGFIGCVCVGMKFITLYMYRKDVAHLIATLKGAASSHPCIDIHAHTTLSAISYYLSVTYELITIFQRLLVWTDFFFMRKLRHVIPFYVPWPHQTVPAAIATFAFIQGSACMKSFVNAFTDTLFLLISNQICHRLYLLSNTFKLIGAAEEEKAKAVQRNNVMDIPLSVWNNDDKLSRTCIQEHIAVIKIVEKFEVILNKLFISQVISGFLSISIVMYSATQAESIGRAMKVAPWFFFVCLQLFVSCFSGELIKSRYHDIYLSSYDNAWYNCNQNIRSSLLVVQTYCTKPKELKGAYVFELSLHTFETAIKETFSSFTVVYHLFSNFGS